MKGPRLIAIFGGILVFICWLGWNGAQIMAKSTPDDIIFSHQVHIDPECTDCHDKIEESESALDNNFPSMDNCGECHDIEADEDCGMCHHNPADPSGIPNPERLIIFNHKGHFGRGIACGRCHAGDSQNANLPKMVIPQMSVCLECHDGTMVKNECAVCHGDKLTLIDIHPDGWKHRHGEKASADREWCIQCHREETSCLDCHRGDNLTGNIHELNFVYTHGLDAGNKSSDCVQCHDRRLFCSGCHESENRIPLLHSTLGWLSEHGRMARNDAENCASCHDSGDPICARSGCHGDSDGIKGTDARIHSGGLSRFDVHGPWHSDDGYFCFQCHVNTHNPGVGFCGYCHSGLD